MTLGFTFRKSLKTLHVSASVLLLALTAPALAGGGHQHGHAGDGDALEGVMVHAPVSPAAAPGITTSAVYMTLENHSGNALDLVGVSSPGFEMGHLHKTSMVDGLMTMAPVAQLSIPSHASVRFEPGGLHIMLMGAKASLRPGDTFPVTLVFATGEGVEVPVSVVEPGTASGHDHGAMKMN
nr:copper chaperone PCu(A)C [uncultured Roseibium sp.]